MPALLDGKYSGSTPQCRCSNGCTKAARVEKTSTSSFTVCHELSSAFFCSLIFHTVLHPSHPLCPCLVRGRVFLGHSNPTRSIAALPPAYCSVIFIVLRGRNMTDTRQLNPGFRTRTSQFAPSSVFGSERARLR